MGPKVYRAKLDVGYRDFGLINPFITKERFRLLIVALKQSFILIVLVDTTTEQVVLEKLASERTNVPMVISGGTIIEM